MNENIKPFIPYIAAGIALAIVIYMIKRQFGKATDSLGLSMSDEEKNIEKQIFNNIKVDVRKTTQPIDLIAKRAGELYTAMKGVGTDETVIKRILKTVMSQNDWNALIKNFGIKDSQNLLSWLRGEFIDSANMKYVNIALLGQAPTTQQDLDEILTKRGVKSNLIAKR